MTLIYGVKSSVTSKDSNSHKKSQPKLSQNYGLSGDPERGKEKQEAQAPSQQVIHFKQKTKL